MRTLKQNILLCYLYFICLVAGISLTMATCKKLPFIPGEDAIIFLQAVPASLDCGQSAKIIITGEKNSGYPLPDGTIVTLSASSGSLLDQVELTKGYAETTFQTDNGFTGEVIITARCGLAAISPEQLVITVSQPDITYLFITAKPLVIPAAGSSSSITAQGLDSNMNPVPGKSLWLETSAGSLNIDGNGVTDQGGKVTATLTTSQAATVIAKYKDIEASVDISIEAENQLPTADFTYSPLQPVRGQRIYFNAAESSDTDGKIVSFTWNFGDGRSGQGETVSHVYNVSQSTTYVVTLTIMDDRGGEDVISKKITII